MSSTGIDKARSSNQRIADNTIDITKQIIEDTKIFNATSPEFALAGEQGSSEGSAAGNYLAKSGDVRLGPMGNEFKIVEIIDNEISVSISTANYVPWIILNPEGGLPDDLETIVPGESVFLNQEIILQGGNITNDITLKNSSNIITPDGGDLVLAFGKIIRLYYSQLLAAWVVAWFSSNVGGGGGGNVPDGTIENQKIEWNDVTKTWDLVEVLTMGNTGPFADSGFIRYANDVIFASGRTGADDGNIELKFTTQDELDLTNSNNSTVALLLRAQHAVDPDNLFLISQASGSEGDAFLTAPNNLAILTNLVTVNVLFSPIKALFGTDISLDTNEIFLDNDEDSGIVSVTDDVVQIFTNNIIRAAFTNTDFQVGVPLDMLTNNIRAGGAGEGMTNIGHLDFIDNLATPVGLSIYSDGIDIFANTSLGVKNLKDIGGGGGISFPIDFPELNMGSPVTTTTINFANSDRHFRAIELSDNLIINLTGIPASGALCTIYFTQDGVGGHVPTIPLLDNPDELSNIDTTPGSTTIFTIQAAFSTVLGFTSGKNIFFGSSVDDWANFQAVSDVNFATFDGINIDRFLFSQTNGSPLSGSDTGITSNATGELLSNVPAGSDHIFTVNNIFPAALVISETTLVAQTLVPAAVDDLGLSIAPWNNVFANTGNFNDVIMNTGSITEVAITQYVDVGSAVRGSISGDATTGLTLSTVLGGKLSIQDVITPIATFDNTTGLTIEGNHVINMGNNIINTISELQLSNTNSHTPSNELSIAFDIIDDALKYAVVLTTDTHRWYANTELLATISRIGSNEGQLSIEAVVSNILQANEQLFLASFTNTIPSNGDIWRDLTDGEFKFRQNGVTEVLGGGGEFFGPWTATHDAGSQLLDNLANLNTDAANLPASGTFKLGNNELLSWVKTDNVSVVSIGLRATNLFALTGANLSLSSNDIVDTNLLEGRLSNPLVINVPTASQILNFQFGGVTQWNLSELILTGDNILLGNTLVISDSSTNPVADGIFSRNGSVLGLQIPTFQVQRVTTGTNSGDLNLTKVDVAPSNGEPIYNINFTLFDSPTNTIYSQIKGGIEDVLDAGTLGFSVMADSVPNVNALTIEGAASTSNRTFVSLNAESRIGSDLKFQAPDGSTDLKIFPALQQLGIVVQDNDPFDVGSLGSLGIPVSGTLPTTDAQADGFFGNHKAFLGMFDNGSGTLILFYRDVNGRWASSAGWTRNVLTP